MNKWCFFHFRTKLNWPDYHLSKFSDSHKECKSEILRRFEFMFYFYDSEMDYGHARWTDDLFEKLDDDTRYEVERNVFFKEDLMKIPKQIEIKENELRQLNIDLMVARREYMEQLNRKLKIKLSKHDNPKIYTTTGAGNEFFFFEQ